MGLLEVSNRYQRTRLVAVGCGLVGLLVAVLLGHPVAGVMLCVGLGLGAWNSQRAQQLLAGLTTPGLTGVRRRIAGSVLRRLATVTAIALALAILFRPDGWTVVIGLAFFQLLMLGATSRPLLEELRKV